MAETIQEAMKRVLGKQRPLYRGNALLTTQHLEYFKPMQTPQSVLDENILLKEIITVNPLTSVVQVKGFTLLITPSDKGKYLKTYRTWITDEDSKKIFDKLGLADSDNILAVNITKDYYDPETLKPIKGWNSEQDRYLVRRSIDPKYMGEMASFKLITKSIYAMNKISDDLGTIVSRDATINLNSFFSDSIYTQYGVEPTDTTAENSLFMSDGQDFDKPTVIFYEYEFTPKYSETIPDIITFYEELIKGNLWNTNPEYEGKNPEKITELKTSYKFRYSIPSQGKYDIIYPVNSSLHVREKDNNYKVVYNELIDDSNIPTTNNGYVSKIFVKVGDSYRLWSDWVNDNIIKTNKTISVNSLVISKGSIDSENYFGSFGNLDTVKYLQNYGSATLTKDRDGNTYRLNLSSRQEVSLIFRERTDVTDMMKYSYILNGAFHIPTDTTNMDYIIKFDNNSKLYNSDYQNNLTILENRINQFKESSYYWDEGLNKELTSLPYYTEQGDHYYSNKYITIFNTDGYINGSLLNSGLGYLFENLYDIRNRITHTFNGVDKYGRKNVSFNRRKFLEAYHTLRCHIASLISGIGTYYIHANADKESDFNFSQFYLGYDQFNYKDIYGLDSITPAEPLYNRIILGENDPYPEESFFLSFPIAKRMEITYKGKKYTFENSVYNDSDLYFNLDNPIEKYGTTYFVPAYNYPSGFIFEVTRANYSFNPFLYYNIKNKTQYSAGNINLGDKIQEIDLNIFISCIMNVVSGFPNDGNTFLSFSSNGYEKIKYHQQPSYGYKNWLSGVFLSFNDKDRSSMLNSGETFPEDEWQEYINWCVENNLSIYYNMDAGNYSATIGCDILTNKFHNNEIKVTLYFNRFGLDPNLNDNDGSEVSRTYIAKGKKLWYSVIDDE